MELLPSSYDARMLNWDELMKLALVVTFLEQRNPELKVRVTRGQLAEKSGEKGRTVELFQLVDGSLAKDQLVTIPHRFLRDKTFCEVASGLPQLADDLRAAGEFCSVVLS